MGKRRKKILMISDHGDPLAKIGGEEAGGQNIYVNQLCSHLVHKGYEPHVFTRWSNPKMPAESTAKSGYQVIRITAGPVDFIPKEQFLNHSNEFISGIYEYTAKHKHRYAIIHTHYWLSGLAGLALKKRLNLPVVHTFHSLGKVKHAAFNLHTDQALVREKKEQYIINHVDRIIATCPEEKRQLLNAYHTRPKKISIVPVGIDTRRFRALSQKRARKKIAIDEHKKVILFVGRFAAQKGLPTLLRATAMLIHDLSPRERRSVMLILIGGSDDPKNLPPKEKRQRTRVIKLINDLGLKKYTTLRGRIPNRRLNPYYCAADVCVIPSRYEPFGIVALEAMASGTPQVVSHVGGLQFSVQNLKTGFHAREGDVNDFAYKIRLILQNPNMAQEFSKNSVYRIAQEFTWEKITDEIIKIYSSYAHPR